MGSTWTFRHLDRDVAAIAIAVRTRPWRRTVILRDTEDELYIAEVSPKGGRVITGPVSVAQAVDAVACAGGAA